ncbi:hypothetical protein ACH42_09320 [Endozoicomonas sp. (ex Bugula neritina AB1)]|nr:hypothetical protein ACH42_09320 [Endozoicomonas sp. (ex Bugula neritina AB1)]
MTRLLNRSVLLVAAGAVLCGCSAMNKQTQVDPELVKNKTWVLMSMNGQSASSESRVTIEFRPSLPDQGRISGRAQCNNYFGGYRVADNKITFSSLGSTKMACPTNLMDKEKQYLDAFPMVDSLNIQDNELTLKQRNGSMNLTYVAETSVVSGELVTKKGYFPAGSEIIIKLQDNSMGGQPEGVIGIERVRLGRDISVGFKYTVNYAPQLVKPGRNYELSAQVLQRGKLLYTTKLNPSVRLNSAVMNQDSL